MQKINIDFEGINKLFKMKKEEYIEPIIITNEVLFSSELKLLMEDLIENKIMSHFPSHVISYSDYFIGVSESIEVKGRQCILFKKTSDPSEIVGGIFVDTDYESGGTYIEIMEVSKNYRNKNYGLLILSIIQEMFKETVFYGEILRKTNALYFWNKLDLELPSEKPDDEFFWQVENEFEFSSDDLFNRIQEKIYI